MSFYLYAETAFNHEGDLDYLKRLILDAKEAGVNGVKFQVLIDVDEFMSKKHSIYSQFRNWLFTPDEWGSIFSLCAENDLDVIMMPLDLQSLHLCSDYNVKYFDIHSVSFHDEQLLTLIKKTTKPVILGLGGRTLDEIQEKVFYFSDREIILMHGYQSFPTDIETIKLQRIEKLKLLYPQCKIGYADHTASDDEYTIISNEYAYMLGARVFEKHITFERGVDRIDASSAIDKEGFIELKQRLNKLETIYGALTKTFKIEGAEHIYRLREKKPVSKRDLKKGHVLTEADIAFKMVDQDGRAVEKDSLLGKKLLSDVDEGDLLTTNIFE